MVIASAAKQSCKAAKTLEDCFVAALLAMTAESRFLLLTGKISASAFPILGKGSLRIGKGEDDVDVYNY
jgi:hypothetical protein